MLKSSTTIENSKGDDARLPPIHPGEILLEEFLKPLAMSQYRLAHELGVPPPRVNEIVHGKRAVTADTALRLGRYVGTSAHFWMNLQSMSELDVAAEAGLERVRSQVTPRAV